MQYVLLRRLFQTSLSDCISPENTWNLCFPFLLSSSSIAALPNVPPGRSQISDLGPTWEWTSNLTPTRVHHKHWNSQLNCTKMFAYLHYNFFPEKPQEVSNSVCCWRNIFEARTLHMFSCLYVNIEMLGTWTTKSLFSFRLEICFA